jgi:hypothetical protein
MNHFRASAHVPPGLAIVLCGDVIVFFGPMGALADKMQKAEIPGGSMIHCSMKDYLRISKGAQKAAPNAPSIEQQNKEFEGWHNHPKEKWNFRVSMEDGNPDLWKWRRAATTLHGTLPIDFTLYPTAESAYLAAIGE